MDKKILDVTCGSRTIWFDKNNPAALYCDKRRVTYKGYWKSGDGKSERDCTVDPDVLCDFTALPFPANSFPLVVFDPPHLTGAKETAWLVKKYGKLDDTWPQMIHDGFQECMRVLKPDGTLIFKRFAPHRFVLAVSGPHGTAFEIEIHTCPICGRSLSAPSTAQDTTTL